MEPWGASLFGNPCRECMFDWSQTPTEALRVVSAAPRAFAELTVGVDGTQRGHGWSVAEYVSHVADNLRQWSERVQSGRGGQITVSGYDPDELAVARGYATIPMTTALWSLEHSAAAWVDVMTAALREHVTLNHLTRGPQRAEDVALNNAHDAGHHLWDIEQILGRG